MIGLANGKPTKVYKTNQNENNNKGKRSWKREIGVKMFPFQVLLILLKQMQIKALPLICNVFSMTEVPFGPEKCTDCQVFFLVIYT